MKRIFLFTLIVHFSTLAYSTGIVDSKQKLYSAYISGDNSLWIEAMNELSSSYKLTGNINTLYELTNSQYGYIGYLIDKNEFDKAKSILSKAEKNIQTLLNNNPQWPDVLGLKAGIYGFKIILYPTQVVINGPRGKEYLEKATEYNELSPYIILEMGNYKYHTPSILGGDLKEAIKYYQYAINLFELTKQTTNNWQYINTLVWLSISYDKIGNISEAKKTLKKILSLEPNFYWVKNDLYPKVERNESIGKTYFSFKN